MVVTGFVLIALALATIIIPLPYKTTMLGVFSTLLSKSIIDGGKKIMKVNVDGDVRGAIWEI